MERLLRTHTARTGDNAEAPYETTYGQWRLTVSTFDRVKKVVVDQLNVEPDEVTPEATFVEDLRADSLDMVELSMAFEEEFQVDIPDEDAEKIKTVQDAVNYIEEKSGS